jgi:hypothetical protein
MISLIATAQMFSFFRRLLRGYYFFPELLPSCTEPPPIQAILHNYISNLQEMQRQCDISSKPIVFYLQPCVGSGVKPPSKPEELSSIEFIRNRCYTTGSNQYLLNKLFYSKVRDLPPSKLHNWHDLSCLFDDYTSPIWLDQVHVSDVGNSIIAKTIASDLERIILDNPQ